MKVTHIAGWLALSALTVGAAGCGAHDRAPVSSESAAGASAAGTAAPASMPGNNPCAEAEFTPQQFTGDWAEAGDGPTMSLGADGTLKSQQGSQPRSGTWSYEPWEFTPGKPHMPPGEADHCVLWLHWTNPAPAHDLVYVPLKVTATSVQLSYVGRGNTITWTRPKTGA